MPRYTTIESIFIDQREPDWVKSLEFGGVPTAVSLLEAGDVWAATGDNCLLIIERKTPEDFLGTLRQKRMFDQVARMRERSRWCYLVITGNFYPGPDGKVFIGHRQTGWEYSALQGALLTIQEMGCFVVHARNDYDFGPAVERLARRHRGEVTVEPRRLSHVLGPGETMLTSLPGLGFEKARTLLEHKKTPAEALVFLTKLGEDDVPGIGDGTKQNIRQVLRLKSDEKFLILSEVDYQFLGLDEVRND